MERIKQGWWLLVSLALACVVPAAMAGPPLLCHPFDIGNAGSLPWQSAGTGWNAPRGDYDTKRLADDTLALLTDSTPVIVRMETLRRAALYGAKDNDAVRLLLGRLKTRADGNAKARANPLSLFDYGYLIETMKQVPVLRSQVAAVNGYDLISQALRMRGNDPGMQFAAALVTAWPKRPEHEDHLRKAVARASADPLVAKNVAHLNP